MTKIQETLDKLYAEPIRPDIEKDFLYYNCEAYNLWEDAREFKPTIKLLDSLIKVKKTEVIDLFFYRKSLIILFNNYAYEIKNVLNYPDDIFEGLSESEIVNKSYTFIHIPLSLYSFFRKIYSWKRQLELYTCEDRLYFFLIEQEKTRTKEENILHYQIPNKINSDLFFSYQQILLTYPNKLILEDIEVEGIPLCKHSLKDLET